MAMKALALHRGQIGRHTLFFLAALATSSIASTASADGALNDARAQDLFKQGRTLIDQGKTEEACAAFRASYELVKKAVTVINLAQCDEKLGKFASALGEFSQGLSLAKQENNKERVEIATDGVSRVEPKVSRVSFDIPPEDADVTLKLDGDELPGVVARNPIPIDPGPHSVVAKAAGFIDWTGNFTVTSEQPKLSVPIPLLQKVAIADPLKPKVVEPPKGHTHKKKPSGYVSPWAVAGFTIGGVSLLTGIITGSVSLGMAGNLKDACTNNTCGPDQEGDLSAALGLANAANVLLPLGVLGMVGGGIAIAVDKPAEVDVPDDEETTKPDVTLNVGPAYIGLSGSF